MIKAVEEYGKMVKLNLHVLYSGLTIVYTLIVLYICQLSLPHQKDCEDLVLPFYHTIPLL